MTNDIIKAFIKDQDSLVELLVKLQIVCLELDLDFDFALEKAIVDVDETPLCSHNSPSPAANGSVFCSECGRFLVGSGMKVNLAKENLWRIPAVPSLPTT